MTRATVLQEVRQMRFEELYARRQRRELTMAEAAELFGVTERTFRRWSVRYEAEGAGPLGARLTHPARSAAQRADAGGHHGHGRSESVPPRAVHPDLQPTLCRARHGTGHGVCAVSGGQSGRYSVCPGRAPRCRRQYHAVSGQEPIDPVRPTPVPLCEVTVRAHAYPEGTLAVFHKPHPILRLRTKLDV